MSGLSFQFQSGPVREQLQLALTDLSLRRLRQEAVQFVNKHVCFWAMNLTRNLLETFEAPKATVGRTPD